MNQFARVYCSWGIFFTITLFSACASTPQTVQLTSFPEQTRVSQIELTSTPFFAQERFQCGPAALATVLVHHGVETSPESLKSMVYLPEKNGSLQTEMRAAARSFGMLTYPLAPRLEDLLAEVSAGHPVLVFQNLSFTWLPQWHYAVVIGYDLEQQTIVLRSGTQRRWTTTLATFERTWARAEYWALVILPAGEIPATARPVSYLNAAYKLEQTGNADAARKAYQAATKQWPSNLIAWMGLGNIAYEMGDYKAAEDAFRHVTLIKPRNPDAWNNLGYAFSALGCKKTAESAIRCAIKVSGDKGNYRESLSDVQKKHETRHGKCQAAQCPAELTSVNEHL